MSYRFSIQRPAEQEIEGAGAAMLRPRRGDRQHIAAQIGFVQPARHGALQDAAARPAMPGDDQNAAPAGGTRGGDKALERAMRLGLGHAVQVEARLDSAAAAAEPLRGGAVDTGELIERRCGGWRWRGLRSSGGRVAGWDRARFGRIAGGTPAVFRQGAAGERRDLARHTPPQLRVFRVEAAHPRPARYEDGAGHARPIECAARYRRCATGR